MSDLLSEPRLSLTQLAKREKVHVVTVWRWALRGCKGHVLESFRVGGRTYTTEDAFERWIVKINAGKAATYVTTRQRQRQIDAAERRCDILLGPVRKKR
jgi:transposase